jgi:uncharacterized membrane protein YGL010W
MSDNSKVAKKPTYNKNTIEKLAFYGSYHSNTLNVLVHLVFIPLIEFSSFGYVHEHVFHLLMV